MFDSLRLIHPSFLKDLRTFFHPDCPTACCEKLLFCSQKYLLFVEGTPSIRGERRQCSDGEIGPGLRRYSYDYFAHPTEQSSLSIPYKELDKIAAAAKKNDRNENFPNKEEDGGSPLEPLETDPTEWGKYGACPARRIERAPTLRYVARS